MHLVVIGPGNMGSLYGARLAASGTAVTLLGRAGSPHIAAIRKQGGLQVDGVEGAFFAKLNAADAAADVAPADGVVVLVNSYTTPVAAESAASILKPEGWALTLQNGLGHVELLSAKLGAHRVLAGSSYISATVTAPGHVRHTGSNTTYLGELDGQETPRLQDLVQRLEAAKLQPQVVPDITVQLWDKFLFNCAVNPLCAITGLPPSGLVADAELNALRCGVVAEAKALAAAKGLALRPEADRRIAEWCVDKGHEPSMTQHLRRGQRTEIDALNGLIVRESEALGLPAPVNRFISTVVRGLERSGVRADG